MGINQRPASRAAFCHGSSHLAEHLTNFYSGSEAHSPLWQQYQPQALFSHRYRYHQQQIQPPTIIAQASANHVNPPTTSRDQPTHFQPNPQHSRNTSPNPHNSLFSAIPHCYTTSSSNSQSKCQTPSSLASPISISAKHSKSERLICIVIEGGWLSCRKRGWILQERARIRFIVMPQLVWWRRGGGTDN